LAEWAELLSELDELTPTQGITSRSLQRAAELRRTTSSRPAGRHVRVALAVAVAAASLAAVAILLFLALHSRSAAPAPATPPEEHGAQLTASQALAAAKADGFTRVVRIPSPGSYGCYPGQVVLGPSQPTGKYKSYLKPEFALEVTDPNVHGPVPGFAIVVRPTAADAAKCAKAEIQQLKHSPFGASQQQPYKVIDDATIDLSPHPAGTPNGRTSYAKATGDYQIYLSHGRVLAMAEAFTQPDAATAENDISKLASQIAGT
jgi:hypothetical protein